jgi:Zn ribbon nucleic-acid-binding protein
VLNVTISELKRITTDDLFMGWERCPVCDAAVQVFRTDDTERRECMQTESHSVSTPRPPRHRP